MSELISKKQAAIAFIDGEDVEFMDQTGQWRTIFDNTVLRVFLDRAQFRLKPRTITLNGIEVPSVKYVAHSGGNCVKISCECPEDAAAIGAALRSIFNPQ